jgi:hypothetical protein
MDLSPSSGGNGRGGTCLLGLLSSDKDYAFLTNLLPFPPEDGDSCILQDVLELLA